MQFFVKKNKKGFTLIELLVVIAIIGILASIVLVSVSGAQKRAKDARVTAAMDQFRTQATLLNDINNSYASTACSVTTNPCTCSDGSIKSLCSDIAQNASGTITIRINTNNQNYCAYAQLQGSLKYWCVDGNLISKDYAVVPTACAAGCIAENTCACE